MNFPRIDHDKIDELKELDPSLALFSQLVGIFKNECTHRIPEMKTYAIRHDYESLGQITHRFRSTAYNLGAVRTAEIAKQIDAAYDKIFVNHIAVEALVEALEIECEAAYQELSVHLVRAA